MAARKAFPPQGGRWPGGPNEGTTDRFVLGGPMWPPAGARCAPLRSGAALWGRGLARADPSFRGPEGAVGIRLVRGDTDCRVGPAALLAMTKNDPARRYVGAHLCVRPEWVGGHAGPPLRVTTNRNFRRGRRPRRSFAFPPQGGRWPEGPDEGASVRPYEQLSLTRGAIMGPPREPSEVPAGGRPHP